MNGQSIFHISVLKWNFENPVQFYLLTYVMIIIEATETRLIMSHNLSMIYDPGDWACAEGPVTLSLQDPHRRQPLACSFKIKELSHVCVSKCKLLQTTSVLLEVILQLAKYYDCFHRCVCNHNDNNDSADGGNLIVPNDSSRIMGKNSWLWSSKMKRNIPALPHLPH